MKHTRYQPAKHCRKSSEPDTPSLTRTLYAAAVQCHRTGQLGQAERNYRQILKLNPQHADSLHLLGVIGLQTGHNEAAAALIRKALALHPEAPSYHCNLGNILQAMGASGEAASEFEQAIRLKPDYADAHMNLGNVLQAMGRSEEAVAHYRQTLALRPDDAKAQSNLGLTFEAMGRRNEAAASFERAVALQPHNVQARIHLGDVLLAANRLEEARQQYEQVVLLQPDHAVTHSNLGGLLQNLGQSEEAIARYEQALRLQPDYAEAHRNLGTVLQKLDRPEEASRHYEQALALDPRDAEAHLNLALNQLRQGDFAAGWANHEWRWRFDRFSSPRRNFPQPQWNGEPLHGQRILLHGEQGLGDCLQFLRYLPMVQARGGTVILELPAGLRRLAAELAGVELIVFGDPLPRFDWHCPLMSLPRAFDTNFQNLPATVPYLTIPAEAARKASAFPWPTEGLRVGLVWAGSPKHANDRQRSLALSHLLPLVGIEGIHFFSLQIGAAAQQLASVTSAITDLAPVTTDMADTAAQMEHLDLVIGVDTSVTHLAGALAKPTWLLLPRCADWRWFTEREDSPWYPTMRLFRQRKSGNWSEIVDRVSSALVSLRASN